MENPATGKASPNWALLAGLRFVLALLVAVWHTSIAVGSPHNYIYHALGGNMVVPLFLLISGFSISSSYSRSRGGFFRRRFWRIVPNYWLGCLLALAPFLWERGYLNSTVGNCDAGIAPFRVALDFLGLQPIIAAPPLFNMALWTMGAEEVFYLLTPLIFLLPTGLIFVVLAISAAGFATSGQNVMHGNAGWAYLQMLWPYALGVLLYRHRGNGIMNFLVVAVPAILGVMTIKYSNLPVPIWSFIIPLLIVNGDKIILNKAVERVFNYLGDLSFPLYVVHFPLAWLAAVTKLNHVPVPVLILGSCLFAAVVLKFYDRPLRKIGRSGLPPRHGLDEPPHQVPPAAVLP